MQSGKNKPQFASKNQYFLPLMNIENKEHKMCEYGAFTTLLP